jgi:putative MATE family efflux protein
MKKQFLTSGSITKGLISFSFPMLVISFIQQMFGFVDMLFVGNYIGKLGAAAVGASSVIITCLIGLFSGITIGVGVLSARLVGGEKWNEFNLFVKYVVKIGFIIGTIGMFLGLLVIKKLLEIFETPNEVIVDALLYARLYLLGLVPMFLYQVYASFFKAMNKVHIPLYCMMSAGFMNIILNMVLIIVLEFGIFGVALATTISQWFGLLLMMLIFRGYHKMIKSELDYEYMISKKELKNYLIKVLQIGLPAGLQAILLTFSNVIMQYFVNQLGTNQMAAFAAYFKIENIIYLPILAMGQTVLIFVSQNLGANKSLRIKKGVLIGFAISISITIMSSFFLIQIKNPLIWLLIKDVKIVDYCGTIILMCFPFYFLYAILELSGNVIRGFGKSYIPMFTSILSLGIIRIGIVIFWASGFQDLKKIAMVFPITWGICAFLNLIFLGIYYLKASKKELQKG